MNPPDRRQAREANSKETHESQEQLNPLEPSTDENGRKDILLCNYNRAINKSKKVSVECRS